MIKMQTAPTLAARTIYSGGHSGQVSPIEPSKHYRNTDGSATSRTWPFNIVASCRQREYRGDRLGHCLVRVLSQLILHDVRFRSWLSEIVANFIYMNGDR